MEPALLVVGLNHRSATLATRERFWISDNRRYEVMRQLQKEDGIEEVVVLSTHCRTEFLFWASTPTIASNSLLRFLSCEYGLKLSEWEHFYRLMDEVAVTHIFRVACGLDCLVLGEPQIVAEMKGAWEQARAVGACGRYLDAVLEKALAVQKRARSETAIGKFGVSIPVATLAMARNILGSLAGKKVLLLGGGKMSELSARHMAEAGVAALTVIDPSAARAQEVAQKIGGTAADFTDRWKCMVEADVFITGTGCPHFMLTKEEAERIASERKRNTLLIFDIGMPRDVDPEVRRVDGIVLYDLDSLDRGVKGKAAERTAAVAEAEKIVLAEAQAFRNQFQVESVVPTIVGLQRRLDEICRQELESFIEERGPFTREQDQSLHAITAQLIRTIASSLTRELKEMPEKKEQEQMTAAMSRLFHLESPAPAPPGANLENKGNATSQRAVANY